MRYILCQPAIQRFKWELEVCVTRLHRLGITDIVLLFSEHDPSIPWYFEKMGCEVHVYPDDRVSKEYIPSIKPYLWANFLGEDKSRENQTYFYMDADVVFRDIPIVESNPKVWYGSNCESYLSPKYIDSKGHYLLEEMCSVIGVEADVIRKNNPTAGAQWVITNPTYAYWYKVYIDSINLYNFFNLVEPRYIGQNDSKYVPIQKWTAEMWAQLWNVYLFDKETEVHPELDFCWATDHISRYKETKILHNAGVVDDKGDLFFKGKYVYRTPFTDDFSFVNQEKASYEYVKAMMEVNTK